MDMTGFSNCTIVGSLHMHLLYTIQDQSHVTATCRTTIVAEDLIETLRKGGGKRRYD